MAEARRGWRPAPVSVGLQERRRLAAEAFELSRTSAFSGILAKHLPQNQSLIMPGNASFHPGESFLVIGSRDGKVVMQFGEEIVLVAPDFDFGISKLEGYEQPDSMVLRKRIETLFRG